MFSSLKSPDERGAFISGKELGLRKISNAKNKRAIQLSISL
jgi:hypothetical protein